MNTDKTIYGKNKKIENLLNKTPNAAQNLCINLVPSRRLFLAIFIISAASLSFEIIITRISSIIFTFNYAYILVSLAILGLCLDKIAAMEQIYTVGEEMMPLVVLKKSLFTVEE